MALLRLLLFQTPRASDWRRQLPTLSERQEPPSQASQTTCSEFGHSIGRSPRLLTELCTFHQGRD